MGFALFLTRPSGVADGLYGSGWKASFTIHVRRECLVEGRVRFEVGEFSEGLEVFESPYTVVRSRAQTRLVGYDWLIPLGLKRETGLDLILGIGGAHWFLQRNVYNPPGSPYPNQYTEREDQLAFAGTLGFRFRLTRQVELELHHVFTSHPGNQQDFEDGELSHTALGVGIRF